MPKPKDPEATAMQTIALLLGPLAPVERDRIAHWVWDRYVSAPLAAVPIADAAGD